MPLKALPERIWRLFRHVAWHIVWTVVGRPIAFQRDERHGRDVIRLPGIGNSRHEMRRILDALSGLDGFKLKVKANNFGNYYAEFDIANLGYSLHLDEDDSHIRNMGVADASLIEALSTGLRVNSRFKDMTDNAVADVPEVSETVTIAPLTKATLEAPAAKPKRQAPKITKSEPERAKTKSSKSEVAKSSTPTKTSTPKSKTPQFETAPLPRVTSARGKAVAVKPFTDKTARRKKAKA